MRVQDQHARDDVCWQFATEEVHNENASADKDHASCRT
jgi:hypothetical protein